MEKAQEMQPHVTINGEKETEFPESTQYLNPQSTAPVVRNYKKWLKLAMFSFLLVSGQSAATLLGRLYFDKGGKSKWLGTLVQTAGFPILLPFLCITGRGKNQISDEETKSPSVLVLGSIYVVLGSMLAAVCMLFSVGLQHLPVSTYSLITATQLGFNALFSFFLNSQKCTAFIVNAVVLLTTSSALLVVQGNSSGSESSKGKYVEGFICTLAAAAGYAFILSLTQLVFDKILRKQTVKQLVDFMFYEALVASLVIVIGLFASGEWNNLKTEINEFELSKASYAMTLIWTALSWQISTIGMIGLIVSASALFANVISALCLPIVPILAVFIFNDKMTGVKAVSMVLAVWGFVSYIYQHYLEDSKSKNEKESASKEADMSLIERN